jgi:hypothetical protein
VAGPNAIAAESIAPRGYPERPDTPADPAYRHELEASTSVTTTRWLSLSALLQVLPAPISTRCQKPPNQGEDFSTREGATTHRPASSICRLAASDSHQLDGRAENLLVQGFRRRLRDQRVLIDWSVLACATFVCQPLLASPQRFLGALLAVMSRAILEHPTIRPARSRSGEIVSETSMRCPAFVTRTV